MIEKIQPQAIEVEREVLANCIAFEATLDLITFLLPKHFYDDRHLVIFTAILQVDKVSLSTVLYQLKANNHLDIISYFLTITDFKTSVHNIEYSARIIQQMFIKRELYRITHELQIKAIDPTVDCVEIFNEVTNELMELETVFDPDTSVTKVVSNRTNELETLTKEREGNVKSGLSTGYKRLDNHFRFKPKSFVIINGHDNVGKTYAILHLAVCSNLINGWRWILCCLENNEARVRQDLIQSKTGKHISALTQEEFDIEYEWALQNFTIIAINTTITAPKLLRIGRKLCQASKYDAFFIDPYNALELERSGDKFFNGHEYHYSVTNQMRAFIKQTGCCIYLSTHAVTEALRRTHKDGEYAGFPMPPQKADVEGGGKFANRADDFITIHRYTQHTTDFNQTHLHIRKIKDIQTGGRQTVMDDPVKLFVEKGYFGLFDEEQQSPITTIKDINYVRPF